MTTPHQKVLIVDFGSQVTQLIARRLREAAAFWEHVTAEHGTEYREEIWRHPERQPTAEDLEDPAGYAGRRSAADASAESLDDELRKLLEGGFGDAPREG